MYHADGDKVKCDLHGGRRYTFVEYKGQNHAEIELIDASFQTHMAKPTHCGKGFNSFW
jgi:hypothetical protein